MQGFLGCWSCVQGTERKAYTGYRSNRDLILSKVKVEMRKKQAEGGWVSDSAQRLWVTALGGFYAVCREKGFHYSGP